MPDDTKIALSETELDKVLDSEWILTKHRIIEKVYALLNRQVPVLKAIMDGHSSRFGDEILYSVPKITKGENYLQLPYVILDQPAVFAREHIFAIRTMFWWGNFFSITILVKGIYKDQYKASIQRSLDEDASGLFICVNDNEWEHHFGADNYARATKNSLNENAESPFIKIAIKYELRDWNNLPELFSKGYERIVKLLTA